MGPAPSIRGCGLALVVGLLAIGSARADSRQEAQQLLSDSKDLAAAGSRGKALAKVTRALQVDPDLLEAYEVAIPLWLEAGEYAELTKYLEIATTRHRDYAFAWYTLGYVYRLRDRPELAVIAYETYLQLRPKDPDPRFGLALALIDNDEKPRALVELLRYLRLERRPERQEYKERARALVVELGGSVPKEAKASVTDELGRARELIASLRYASALALLDSLEATTTNERGEAWLLRARAHLGAGRPDAAIAAAFIALGHRPDDRASLDALADAFDESGSAGAVGSYFRSLAER